MSLSFHIGESSAGFLGNMGCRRRIDLVAQCGQAGSQGGIGRKGFRLSLNHSSCRGLLRGGRNNLRGKLSSLGRYGLHIPCHRFLDTCRGNIFDGSRSSNPGSANGQACNTGSCGHGGSRLMERSILNMCGGSVGIAGTKRIIRRRLFGLVFTGLRLRGTSPRRNAVGRRGRHDDRCRLKRLNGLLHLLLGLALGFFALSTRSRCEIPVVGVVRRSLGGYLILGLLLSWIDRYLFLKRIVRENFLGVQGVVGMRSRRIGTRCGHGLAG